MRTIVILIDSISIIIILIVYSAFCHIMNFILDLTYILF